MSKVIFTQNEIPFPEDYGNGNKITKFRYRIVNSNRNQSSDWSVINYAEQDVLKYEATDGMPRGGTTGQVAAKDTDVDYDVGWYDVVDLIPSNTYAPPTPAGGGSYVSTNSSALLPSGGNNGEVLTKVGSSDYIASWQAVPHELPVAGTTGQALVKTSASDYAVAWQTISADPQDSNLVIGLGIFA